MKRIICFIVMLFIIITGTSSALGAGFDISIFEKEPNTYSIYREDESIFIELNLSAEEADFSHKNNSQFYYNAIYPNIIILDAGTKNEVVIPRIWIYYRTENEALSIKNVEFTIYNSKFSFAIEDSKIKALEKGTISEELVILIDKKCLEEFIEKWLYIASVNKPIEVKLIGTTDTVEFEVPAKIADAGEKLFWSYIHGLKTASASTLDYSGTPVITSAKHKPVPAGTSMTYRDSKNKLSFTMPSGWAIVEENDEDGTVSAKIRWESADRKKHSNIRYSAFDMYASMLQEGYTETDIGVNRREFNNSLVTKADFVEMMGLRMNEVKYEKYGDYGYYTYLQTQTDIINNAEISVTLKRYYNFDNGIMYCFSFAGEESKFDDFEKILTSVKHEH